MTRITNSMMTRTLLRDLDGLRDGLSKSQLKMSSGSRINRPSDDPFGTARAMGLRSEMAGIQQHQRNVKEATSWQDVTDTALSGINDVIQRARELLVRGGNDPLGDESREALASELDGLLGTAKDHANATYAGRYVLAGTATATRPYNQTDDAYHGDAGMIAREIGPNVAVQINVHASGVLGDATTPDGKLLDTLRQAAANLRGGTAAELNAVRTTNLSALDDALTEVTRMRATVGSTTNRIQSAGTALDRNEETALKLLDGVESADIAQTAIELQSQRTAYEAALRSGAQIIQPSLIDFLRYMPTTLKDTRFGDTVIPDEHTLEFPEGLIGLPSRRWAVLQVGDGPFRWLQSLDDASLALPVCDPRMFLDEVPIDLSESDRERIGLTEGSELIVWTTVRAMDGGWVTNLRAPIVVVDCSGWQLVNRAADAPLRAPLNI